jgi:hypothetical protein
MGPLLSLSEVTMFTTLFLLATLIGPPWISIEYPANPLDTTTRNAYLLVHSFHHETAVRNNVTGEAVTWENGTRRAVPLRLQPTSRTGVYKLNKQWTDGTPWVLVITAGEKEHGAATALVSVDRQGVATRVDVPSQPYRDFRVPREPNDADLAAAFRAAGGTGLAAAR